MVLKQAASAIALVLMSSIAIAQQSSDAVRLRGTIESKDHQVLDVKARSSENLKVKLAENAPDGEKTFAVPPNITVVTFLHRPQTRILGPVRRCSQRLRKSSQTARSR